VDLLELEGLNDPRDFSSYGSVVSRECSPLLARDAFVITNRRDIAVIFVRLSVCLSGVGVHCDNTVHVSADLSSRLDSPMLWAPCH